MKKLYFAFFIFLMLFCDKVSALEYENATKKNMLYEINGFYIQDDYLIVNGWAVSDRNIQHYYDETTHSYSLVLNNLTNQSDVLYYEGKLLNVDKTQLFKYITTNYKCSANAINKPLEDCYMELKNVGFEFKIPLSDLTKNTSYEITLRMHSKKVDLKYQTKIYAPNISDYVEKDGVRYELYSRFDTTNIIMLSDMLFVKDGPGLSSKRMYSYKSCSLTSNTLYWRQWEVFTNLQEVAMTTNSYDSETWFKVLFDQGVCEGGRSRAFMGYNYVGWMPSTYTDFDGVPAVVKITIQNYASINEIKTYTSPLNTNTKVKIKLHNNVNQTNNIKLYQNGVLLSNQNVTFNGDKEMTIDFNNNGMGNIKVVVTEPSGYVTELSAPIYTSNYSNYISSGNNITINPTTPIMVVSDKNYTRNIYETIKVSIPYKSINIVSGKPIQSWAYIEYFTDNNEIVLNNNVMGNVLFPSQESTLNHSIVNGKVKVDLIKVSSNANQALLNLPEYILDKNNGNVYLSSNVPSGIKTIYGDRKWYTPINDPLGTYNYVIDVSNLGVNRVSVKFDCQYTTTKTLFGSPNSYYVIKRTYVPNNLYYIFNKKYTYQELLEIGGR